MTPTTLTQFRGAPSSAKPVGPDLSTEAPILVIRRLVDELVDGQGFPVNSPYVETCILPSLGPSSVLLLRRLGAWLTASPIDAELAVDLAALSTDLGLRRRAGPHSPIQRSLFRLRRFGFAEWQGQVFAVRTFVAPVSGRQLAELSPGVRAVHYAMTRRSA